MLDPHDLTPDEIDRTLVRLVAARLHAGTRSERDAAGAALLQFLAAACSNGDPCPVHRTPGVPRPGGRELHAEVGPRHPPRADSLA
ncbi:hypothetical protein [Cellulomonas fimi]|uniref:Uncharacterized protein n=1 Tax=Cellulomonas fimi (strain ATCC 484 / DSM 20113 / JCM 1341 / CCUG 24087 / LMG 16345 / NBRC 15513 / NCIMB 8980 / NCTC 7547 / NRS-133) TaxID=590998 RepID=F4H3B6_CELFA|nr:hypothetical protein [Cellulomonas fimi]AEE45337.1 hypothetical protein Celf_1202 [Cellulomonas fimi ATCC 484]NNH08182.1 hypothetical protein [Cellulomonas fimi]VEH29016.1 Uncharacterised protein [Cellulomonas fimi]